MIEFVVVIIVERDIVIIVKLTRRRREGHGRSPWSGRQNCKIFSDNCKSCHFLWSSFRWWVSCASDPTLEPCTILRHPNYWISAAVGINTVFDSQIQIFIPFSERSIFGDNRFAQRQDQWLGDREMDRRCVRNSLVQLPAKCKTKNQRWPRPRRSSPHAAAGWPWQCCCAAERHSRPILLLLHHIDLKLFSIICIPEATHSPWRHEPALVVKKLCQSRNTAKINGPRRMCRNAKAASMVATPIQSLRLLLWLRRKNSSQ